MRHTIDLNAYLARIGEIRQPKPDLRTLRNIVGKHSGRISFENLNVLMRWPVDLQLPALEEKLIVRGRGGYCYEQNLLLKAALEGMGFRVTGLAARVIWNSGAGVITPRSHMLLSVDINSVAHVVDVGFGGLTPTGVLRLEEDTEQPTAHETFRLKRVQQDFVLEVALGGEWKALYRFDLQPQLLPDYEISNWYVSTNPRSHFTRNLVVARTGLEERYTLNNTEFTVRPTHGAAERRNLASAAELREVLQNTFLIRLPEASELDQVLENIVANSFVYQPAGFR